MTRKLGLLAAALFALSGCSEDVDSDDVATDAVYANMYVTAPGDGESHLLTTLRVGGPNSNTYLDLTDYDSLVAYVNDTGKNMAQSGDGYVASFPYESEGTPYRFAFLRSHAPDSECAGVSAPNSSVTLPAPFDIVNPVSDSAHSRNADLVFTWSGSGAADGMSWTVDGPCILTASDTIDDDDGSFTIPADTIAVIGSANNSCTATLTVSRTRAGELDPAFVSGEGGVISAAQRRTRQFVTEQ